MGAAIPHALMLCTSLPAMLSFAPEEINTSVTTGTVQCIDEMIPEEENEEEEEGGMRIREKSRIDVVIKFGDGVDVNSRTQKQVNLVRAKGSKSKGPPGVSVS